LSEPANSFETRVTAEVVGHAEHPAELTAEERAHLGLPAEDQHDSQQEEGR
jgi:hypothetical protein